jgi:hypothetical protein
MGGLRWKKMRKIISVLLTGGLIGLLIANSVNAADTADITVTVTCRMLSVGVNPSSYAFGAVNESSETVASSEITVTNNGNVTEDLEVKLTDPGGWTALQSGTPGEDQYILGAIFRTSAPTTDDYDDSEDMLSTSYVESTTAIFAKDGDSDDQKGFNVAASGTRNLWFYFFAPSATTVATQQSITVTVRATAS